MQALTRRNAINIQFTEGGRKGQVAFTAWPEAQDHINKGQARAVSNTMVRAHKLGIDISNFKSGQKSERALKDRIKAARQQASKPQRVKREDKPDQETKQKRKREKRQEGI